MQGPPWDMEAQDCDWFSRLIQLCTLYIIQHHTVQVAICALVNALVLRRKTPPAQVAAGDDHHECKWSIYASWWKGKHHQRKLQCQDHLGHKSIGAGCSNQPGNQPGRMAHLYIKDKPQA